MKKDTIELNRKEFIEEKYAERKSVFYDWMFLNDPDNPVFAEFEQWQLEQDLNGDGNKAILKQGRIEEIAYPIAETPVTVTPTKVIDPIDKKIKLAKLAILRQKIDGAEPEVEVEAEAGFSPFFKKVVFCILVFIICCIWRMF